MGNKQSQLEADDTVARIATTSPSIAMEDAEEPVEVPPPMQPISSVSVSTAVDDSKKVSPAAAAPLRSDTQKGTQQSGE